MSEAQKPKPAPIDPGLHWPSWRQITAWLVAAATYVVTYSGAVPDSVWHAVPAWVRPVVLAVAMLILAFTHAPGAPSPAKLAEIVGELVALRASTPPTTPAAVARAQSQGPVTAPRPARINQDLIVTGEMPADDKEGDA